MKTEVSRARSGMYWLHVNVGERLPENIPMSEKAWRALGQKAIRKGRKEYRRVRVTKA